MEKRSNYRTIISENKRYKLSHNPLHALLSESAVFKSYEQSQQESEIEAIIQQELTEDFKIGGHVDYDYLLASIKNEDDFYNDKNRISGVRFCSLFIDLRNFTRRAMFISDPGIETLDEITSLKQKAISTWIKLARYYQGHIHSITGDGLMILLGGTQPEDKDEWTLGARALLLSLRIIESTDWLNEALKNTLKAKDKEKHIQGDNLLDIKVGLEYSPDTLVNPQGVIVTKNGESTPVGEIKMTSFEVDFSAKLLGYYKEAKEKIDGSPKYGRLLIIGEQYKELMVFKNDVSVIQLANYKKRMFDVEKSKTIFYLDCKPYKEKILTLEDVATLCDVYDTSVETKNVFVNIAREEKKIQHG